MIIGYKSILTCLDKYNTPIYDLYENYLILRRPPNMFKDISDIILWSGNYKKLAAWYKEKLGLKQIGEVNHPKDMCIGFEVGDVELWIGHHGGVKGKNKDKYRIMFNIVVDSVTKSYEYLLKKGVKFMAKPFKAPTFDKYFATFSDLDGNTVQLIGYK